jgi:hypothetical protein
LLSIAIHAVIVSRSDGDALGLTDTDRNAVCAILQVTFLWPVGSADVRRAPALVRVATNASEQRASGWLRFDCGRRLVDVHELHDVALHRLSGVGRDARERELRAEERVRVLVLDV